MAKLPCPQTQDGWKDLVAGLGGDEARASLAYFRNKGIPDLATAKSILGGFEGVAGKAGEGKSGGFLIHNKTAIEQAGSTPVAEGQPGAEDEKTVGVKLSKTGPAREALGMEERPAVEHQTDKEHIEWAKTAVANKDINPEAWVDQINKTGKMIPDVEPWQQVAGIHYHLWELNRELEAAGKAQEAAVGKSPEAQQAAADRFDKAQAASEQAIRAVDKIKTPIARGLRQFATEVKAQEFEPAQVLQRAKIKKGADLSTEERTALLSQIEDLKSSAAFGDTLQNIYHSEIGIDPETIKKGQHKLVSTEEYNAAKKMIQESFLSSKKGAVGPQFGEGGKVTDLNFDHVKAVGKMIVWNMEEAGLKVGDAVNKVIKDSGEAIRPYITPALQHLRETSANVEAATKEVSEARKQTDKAKSIVDALEAKKAPKREYLAKLQGMKDKGEMLERGGKTHKLTDAENDLLDKQIAKLTKELTPPKTESERTSEAIKTVQTRIESLEELQTKGEMLSPARKVQVNKQLAALRKQAADLTKELTPERAARPPKSPYELLADGKKRLATARQKMKDVLADDTFVPTPHVKMAIDNEYIASRAENRRTQIEIKAKTEPTRPKGTLDKIAAKTGVLKSFLYNSPHMMRQLQGMFGVNPRAWGTGMKAATRSLFSAEAAEQLQGRVRESPNFNLYQGWGLENDMSPHHGGTEFIGSDKPSRIPIIGRTFAANARSYAIGGNVAEQSAMDMWVAGRGGAENIDPQEGMDYAKVLNDVVRRGKTGLTGNWAKVANIVFASPKAVAGDIGSYIDAFNPKLSHDARMAAARSLAARYAAGLSFMGAAALAGCKVHFHPLDRKFGTVEVGNTGLNVFGGIEIAFRDVAESIYQAKFGKVYSFKTVNGSHFVPAKYGHDAWDVLFNLDTSGFLGSHLSPIASEARNIYMSQQKGTPPWEQPIWREKPADIAEEFVYPIGAKAIVDAWKDGGYERALLVAPFALTGEGANTTKPMKTLHSTIADLDAKLKAFPRTPAGDNAAAAYAWEHGGKTGLINPDKSDEHTNHVRYPSAKSAKYKPSAAQLKRLGITTDD